MEYKSTTYITHNEINEQQVEIVYNKTFLQRLFGDDETKEAFVSHDGITWYRKDTGDRVEWWESNEIAAIIQRHKHKSKYGI